MLHYLVGIGSVPNVALAAATPPNKARILIGSGSIVRIRLRMRLEIVPFRLLQPPQPPPHFVLIPLVDARSILPSISQRLPIIIA